MSRGLLHMFFTFIDFQFLFFFFSVPLLSSTLCQKWLLFTAISSTWTMCTLLRSTFWRYVELDFFPCSDMNLCLVYYCPLVYCFEGKANVCVCFYCKAVLCFIPILYHHSSLPPVPACMCLYLCLHQSPTCTEVKKVCVIVACSYPLGVECEDTDRQPRQAALWRPAGGGA